MRRTVILSLALCASAAGVAVAASAASPPQAAVSGHYVFTYKATNVKMKPSLLDVRILADCAAPCKTFRTAERLKGATGKERGSPRLWKWNGAAYAYKNKNYGGSTCGGRTKTIAKGYDIESTFTLKPTAKAGGRVTAFKGTGKDRYLLTKAGKAGGCKPGEYDFVITAKTS